jgi:hypothetical protein
VRVEGSLIREVIDLHVSHARPILQQKPICDHTAGRVHLNVAHQGQLVARNKKRSRACQPHAHITARNCRSVAQSGAVLRVHGKIGGLGARIERRCRHAHTRTATRIFSRTTGHIDCEHSGHKRQPQLERKSNTRPTSNAEASHV